jgi:hypothetical protein
VAPKTIRRALIVAATVVLVAGLFISIALMDQASCYGMDAMCWMDRWRFAVGFGSAAVAIGLLLYSIPDHGRTIDPPDE